MREGSLLIVLDRETRPRLKERADLDHRTVRDEASYLITWALDELERREAPTAVAVA